MDLPVPADPLVSVIIPARDAETTIGRQLDALAAQDHPGGWEVTVVDDGSADETAAVAASRRPHLPRLRVVRTPDDGESGVNRARNLGAGHSAGDLLLFCDADDIVAPGWLSALAGALGGAAAVGGALERRTLNNAGHLGHVVAAADGPRCACGGQGCLELVASGTALVTQAHAAGWTAPRPDPTARDLAVAARAGEPMASAVFRRAGRALAAAFASVCALCDLDRVVVGGGVAQAGAPLFDAIETGMREFSGLSFLHRVTVRPAALGQDAGLVGAAVPILRPERYAGAAAPPRLRERDVRHGGKEQRRCR
jgi:glycosyltransferase involved in cell wall biosynthesis